MKLPRSTKMILLVWIALACITSNCSSQQVCFNNKQGNYIRYRIEEGTYFKEKSVLQDSLILGLQTQLFHQGKVIDDLETSNAQLKDLGKRMIESNRTTLQNRRRERFVFGGVVGLLTLILIAK